MTRTLRDAGFEVIYLGLFQTADTVASAAVQEDADVVGLSILSGAHLTLVPRVIESLRSTGAEAGVVVGGIIPAEDVDVLRQAGVAAVLTPGASAQEIIAAVRSAANGSAAR